MVKQQFDNIVQEYNEQFGRIEQIKKFELLPNEWTVDGGELTATLKMKRRVISKTYAKEIAGLYETA